MAALQIAAGWQSCWNKVKGEIGLPHSAHAETMLE